MTCSILVGGAWGDEGKGKCITYLCDNDKPSIIARAGVGPNAGHSVEFNGEKYGLRLTPSGFVHKDAKLMIGAGVLVNPDVLFKEFEDLKKYDVKERMVVDPRCAIITEEHISRDKNSQLALQRMFQNLKIILLMSLSHAMKLLTMEKMYSLKVPKDLHFHFITVHIHL